MSRVIFSYYHYNADLKIPQHQKEVITKLTDIPFESICYHCDLTPDKIVDFCVYTLLYERHYDSILILDIDCIPLTNQAINYTFEQAEKGKLIGNIQRANHIDNDQHLYVGPPAMCFSKDTFEKMNKPSFEFTHRGDVGEEITYKAEENNIEIEFYMPSEVEKFPDCGQLWDLKDDMPKFGIGTTYINNDKQEMFYHLFESRFQQNVELFINKCKQI